MNVITQKRLNQYEAIVGHVYNFFFNLTITLTETAGSAVCFYRSALLTPGG